MPAHVLFKLHSEEPVFCSGASPPNNRVHMANLSPQFAAVLGTLQSLPSQTPHAQPRLCYAQSRSESLHSTFLSPGPMCSCCRTSASAACRVAVVNDVSFSSTMLSLEDKARKLAPTAVHPHRLSGAFVSLVIGRGCERIGQAVSQGLPQHWLRVHSNIPHELSVSLSRENIVNAFSIVYPVAGTQDSRCFS